jgi:DNA primase
MLGEFRTIRLYLDNDPAGRQATTGILKRFTQVKDMARVIYPDHKDFNEFWMR